MSKKAYATKRDSFEYVKHRICDRGYLKTYRIIRSRLNQSGIDLLRRLQIKQLPVRNRKEAINLYEQYFTG
jgi:hypothetical protein